MKRSKLVISAFGVLAVAFSFVIFNSLNSETVEARYTSSYGSLHIEQSANDYQEWLKSKMIDFETGEVITPKKYQEIMSAHLAKPKNLEVQWIEHGPDNIGGRTRAILIDHTNQQRIWSGGVTGGLYKSENRANNWHRVDNFPGNQFISSITQDAGGNVYVATGALPEGGSWNGNGLYVTPDGGETWEIVPGTGNYNKINKVAGTRHSDIVFFTTNTGLRTFKYGDDATENVEGYPSSPATIVISSDGELMVSSDMTSRTFISKDKGVTWENKSTGAEGDISPNAGRIEHAISSKKDNNQYSIYASTSSANNRGQWISLNSGDTWHRHTPATGPEVTNGIVNFRDQGGWNNIATFDPTNPKRVIIGGIDLHEWVQVIDNPPSGGWNQLTQWFADPTSDTYVHADNHDLKWDDNNRLFVGNDGGIQISLDLGNTFYEANRGYNIAQFFKIAHDKHGAVLGGTQDNGSLYNNHNFSTYKSFKRVSGGDGFSCAISFFNPNLLITSSQYNNFNRSSDGGQTMENFLPNIETYAPGNPASNPFHTNLYLGEYYDENSEDSVLFIPLANYEEGDVIKVPSRATGDTIKYISPKRIYFSDTLIYDPTLTRTEYIVYEEGSSIPYDLGISEFSYAPSASQEYPPQEGDTLYVAGPLGDDTVVVDEIEPYDYYVGSNDETGQTFDMVRDTILLDIPWDTLTVQDPFQSWFLFSFVGENGSEVWGTRDALILSAANPKWVKLLENLPSPHIEVEFSADLNHIFVKAGGGVFTTSSAPNGIIYRLDSLGSVYSSDSLFHDKVDIRTEDGPTVATTTTVSNTNFFGIGIDPNNPDVLYASQGFNGSVFKSVNATAENPTLTNVGSQGGLAFYDILVDRDDDDILFAATNNGVSVSEDGGESWTDVSHPSFFGTPCYHIVQAWRTWNEGNRVPGEIFVGTHGRGIFSTDALLNVVENHEDNPVKEKEKSSLEVYPNPAKYNSTLSFDLKSESNVNIQFFNLSGRVVKSINKTNMFVGRNEVFFSASELPQGTYIIRVQAGNQIESTKYIKL